MSDRSNPTTNMTLDEQREWVETQLDAGVAATRHLRGLVLAPDIQDPVAGQRRGAGTDQKLLAPTRLQWVGRAAH